MPHNLLEVRNLSTGYGEVKVLDDISIRLAERELVFPAYDYVLKCSHAFNMLDARGAISVTERAHYIGRVRNLSKMCAELYVAQREKMGFPLLKK